MSAAFQLLGTSHAAYSGTYTWTPEHECNGSPVYELGGSGGPVRFVLAWTHALSDRLCRRFDTLMLLAGQAFNWGGTRYPYWYVRPAAQADCYEMLH